MPFNPLAERGLPLERQLRSWSELNVQPYDTRDVHPYTRCRVIVMNGIEAEAIGFSHNDLNRDFAQALDTISQDEDRLERWVKAVAILESDPGTRKVFHLEVEQSGFYRLLQDAASDSSFEEVDEQFGGMIGSEGRALLRAFTNKSAGCGFRHSYACGRLPLPCQGDGPIFRTGLDVPGRALVGPAGLEIPSAWNARKRSIPTGYQQYYEDQACSFRSSRPTHPGAADFESAASTISSRPQGASEP